MTSPVPASMTRWIVRQCGVSAMSRSWSAASPASIGWTAPPRATRAVPRRRAIASSRVSEGIL
jgi:hypothetical protein